MNDNDKKIVLFYTDDDVNGDAIKIARKMGVEIVTTNEVGLGGARDPVHFKYAIDNDYVLVTQNVRHFIPLYTAWSEAGNEHPGVVLVDNKRIKNPLTVAKYLKMIHETHTPESFRNYMEYVKEIDND